MLRMDRWAISFRWRAGPSDDRFGGHGRVWVRAIDMRPPSAAPSLDSVAAVRLGRGHHGGLSGVCPGSSCSRTRGHAGWSNTSSGERAGPSGSFPLGLFWFAWPVGWWWVPVNPAAFCGVCRGSRVHDGEWPHISVRGRVFGGLASIAPVTARRWPPGRSCSRPGVPSPPAR